MTREKFIETAKDRAYMRSIDRNYKRGTRVVARGKPSALVSPTAQKALSRKIGDGKSHYSGKNYSHE